LHSKFLDDNFNFHTEQIKTKIPTTWVKTDWRGKISYEVLIFPFGIGFLNVVKKSVFEPIVVVRIFV